MVVLIVGINMKVVYITKECEMLDYSHTSSSTNSNILPSFGLHSELVDKGGSSYEAGFKE